MLGAMATRMGFWESTRKGWSFIGAAFRMARDNKKLLLPSLLQLLVSIAYIVAWVAALIAVDPVWSDGTWALVGGIATLGSFVIFYFFNGVTVNMVAVQLEGGTPRVGEGAKAAAKNIVAIVFLSLVSTIVDQIVRAVREESGLVGRILAGIVQAVWTTVTFLLLPAIIIEDAGFVQAMKRVRALHKNNLLLIGVGEVGVRAVSGLIGLVWSLLIFGVVYAAFSVIGGTGALVLSLVVGGALFAAFVAFATFVRMAYYTCLYLWAVDVERKGESAPAPLPLAIALGHARQGRREAA
jgi:hypothetical protein